MCIVQSESKCENEMYFINTGISTDILFAGGGLTMKYAYKKLATLILSVCLMLSLVPATFATETITATSGESAYAATVSYNTNGVNFAGVVTPRKSKAIVIIPGVLGSQLQNSSGQMVWNYPGRSMQLECNTNGTSKNTITPYTKEGYGAGDTYKALYQYLQDEYQDTYDILLFSYDWRLSNVTSAAKLAIAINNNYDEVILVAHSMGGLVASKYLANSSTNRNKVDKLITIGTPYTGSVKLLNVAEDGDMGVLVNAFVSKSNLKTLMANFHCTYQLAPTTRYGNNYGAYIKAGTINKSGTAARDYYSQRPWATVDNETKSMFSTATTFHDSLIVNGTHIANSSLVDTYKIVGYGTDTHSKILYDADGNYLDFEANNAGDGTVARYSASNTLACSAANKVYEFEDDHTGLVKNENVHAQISAIIDGTQTKTLAVNNEAEKYDVNEKGWIEGADNKRIYITIGAKDSVDILDDENGTLVIDSENYLVDAQNKRTGYVATIGQGRIKYVLFDGNYTVNVDNDANIDYIKVEYQNNGYYEYSAEYAQLHANSVCISISEYSDMNPTVQAVQAITGVGAASAEGDTLIVPPTNVLDEAQLAERNNY